MNAQLFINLVRSEIGYRTPSVMGDLEVGVNFASIKQVGYMNGLLKRCTVPDAWRLWLVGQLVGRELRESTKELHWAEASAIIDTILANGDFAKVAIGEMLDEAAQHCHAKVQRQSGQGRVVSVSSKHSSRETKETLAEHRQRLKIHLWGQKDWDGAWWEVMCPWCNRPIARPDDAVMHEWLIKRSAIPVSLQKMAIMCEYNCLLVHFQCHADHGQTREFKVRCAKAQYARYGRENIVEWVGGLGLKQHIEISEESEE